MNATDKLTAELEYVAENFAEGKSTLCKVTVKTSDGTLVWQGHYNSQHYGSPLHLLTQGIFDALAATRR